jgi:hypothetical protein
MTNALTVLSLLVSLVTVALCVRSYRVRDLVSFARDGNCHVAQSILGRLHVLSDLDGRCTDGVNYYADRLSSQAIWNGGMSGYPADVQWRLGFVWQTYDSYHMDHMGGSGGLITIPRRLIVVPYWFPAAVFASVPIAWMGGTRKRFGVLALLILVAAIAVVVACLRPPTAS